MTQIVTLKQPHDPTKLAALLDSIPALAPVDLPADQARPDLGITKEARYTMSTDGETVRLEVPDDVDLKAVRDAVQNHDSTPTPKPIDPDVALYRALKDMTTVAQLRTGLRQWLKAKRRDAED